MSTSRYPVTIVATKEEALSQLAGVEPTPLNAAAAATLGRRERLVVTATDIATAAATEFMASLTIERNRQVRVVFLEIARDPRKRDHRRPADEAVAAAIRLGCPAGRAVLMVDTSAEIDLGSLRAQFEECSVDDRRVAGWLGLERAGGATSVIVRSLAGPERLPGSRQLLVEVVKPAVGARVRALPDAYERQPQRWPEPPLPDPFPGSPTVAVVGGENAVHAPISSLGKRELQRIVSGEQHTTDLLPLVHAADCSLDDMLWRAHRRCAPDAPVVWVPGELDGVRRVWGVGYVGREYGPRPTLAARADAKIRVALALVPASVADALERAAELLDGAQLVRLMGTTFRADGYELHDPPAFVCQAGLLDRDRRKRGKLLPYDHGSGVRHAKSVLQLALGAERTGSQIERLVDAGHAEQLGWPRLDGVAALTPVELP